MKLSKEQIAHFNNVFAKAAADHHRLSAFEQTHSTLWKLATEFKKSDLLEPAAEAAGISVTTLGNYADEHRIEPLPHAFVQRAIIDMWVENLGLEPCLVGAISFKKTDVKPSFH